MVVDLEKIIEAPIIRMTHGISGDGTKVSFILDQEDDWIGVITSIAEKKSYRKLTYNNLKVLAMDWHPTDGSMALIMEGNLWLGYPVADWFKFIQISTEGVANPVVRWINQGKEIFFANGEKLCFYNPKTKSRNEVVLQGFPGTPNLELLQFSPNGQYILVGFRKDPTKILQTSLCVLNREGKTIWQNAELGSTMISWAEWKSDDIFVYKFNENNIQLSSDFKMVNLKSKSITVIFSEHYEEGGTDCKGAISPKGDKMIITSEQDGWYHLYLYTFNTNSLEQLTKGEFEDCLTSTDFPKWSRDGTKIVYCSNQGNSTDRQIHVYDINLRKDQFVTNFHGVNFDPFWLPSGKGIVYSRGSATHNVELFYLNLETNSDPLMITDFFPKGLEEQLREPEKIWFTSNNGFKIEGFLHHPYEFDTKKKYPALVYCHGGPQGGQSKGVWEDNPDSVSRFFGWNQYLASKGYYILEVNMRGGAGQGRAFRHSLYLDQGVGDVEDCANAGRYLQNLPNVDPKRIGIYGVSFGGFMTYHNVTRHPEIFAMGIANVSPWDLDLWKAWGEEKYGDFCAAIVFNSGTSAEKNPEIWKRASPHNYADQLRRPIVAFQGMGDDSVNVDQVYALADYCLRHGLEYVVHVYPRGGHIWSQRYIWRDAFKKYGDALDKYLR